MTKKERRIKTFSSRLKKLSDNSKDHIQKLIHILLLIEELPVCTVTEKKQLKKGVKHEKTNVNNGNDYHGNRTCIC